MSTTKYSMIVLWNADDEAFLARVLELPGYIAHGETREEAVEQAGIAIENWIEEAQRLDGKRLCQNANPKDIVLLKRTSLIFQPPRNGISPAAKAAGLLPKIL